MQHTIVQESALVRSIARLSRRLDTQCGHCHVKSGYVHKQRMLKRSPTLKRMKGQFDCTLPEFGLHTQLLLPRPDNLRLANCNYMPGPSTIAAWWLLYQHASHTRIRQTDAKSYYRLYCRHAPTRARTKIYTVHQLHSMLAHCLHPTLLVTSDKTSTNTCSPPGLLSSSIESASQPAQVLRQYRQQS